MLAGGMGGDPGLLTLAWLLGSDEAAARGGRPSGQPGEVPSGAWGPPLGSPNDFPVYP
jgi:hypothetical protein